MVVVLAPMRAAVQCVHGSCDSDSDSDSDDAKRHCMMFVGVLFVQLQHCAAYRH